MNIAGMITLPAPAEPGTSIRTVVRPRPKVHIDYQAWCVECGWKSFIYVLEKEAEYVAGAHDERCVERRNEEMAAAVPAMKVMVDDLRPGDILLTKNLTTIQVVSIFIFPLNHHELELTYTRLTDEAEHPLLVMLIPRAREVSVLWRA